jgi:hypothetical protein
LEKQAAIGSGDQHQLSSSPTQEFEVIYDQSSDPTTLHY